MYRWYRDSEVCFAYIVDVSSLPIGGETDGFADQIQAFKKSRWFSRGWTLQELIEPRKRVFFSGDWSLIYFSNDEFDKASRDELLTSITGVRTDVLQHCELLLNCAWPSA
jgi:hypothetical protein